MSTTTLPYARPASATAPPISPAPNRSIWPFLWPLIRPHKYLVGGALVLSSLHGIAITFQTLTPKYLIDDVLLAQGLSNSDRLTKALYLALLYLFASVVARMLVWHVGYRMFTYVREKVVFALRADFFRHVNHLCLRFHFRTHSGELFSYLFGSPLAQLQNYFQQFTFGAPGALFILLSTVIWIGTWDWLLTVILLAFCTATVLLMKHSQKRIKKLHGEFQATESTVSGQVADLLRGSRDVKLYAMEEHVQSDFQTKAWAIGQKSYERDVRSHVEWMKNETLGYISYAVILVACAWRFLSTQSLPPEQQLKPGEVLSFLVAFGSVQGQLATLFNLSTAKAAAQASVDRISAVLTTASTTPDPIGYESKLPPRGDIQLYNVTFGYDPLSPVLKEITLTIPYGQKVALVGPSGSGKSTITQLLLRLYDPDQGAILIGGLNIRHCAGPDLRHRFGVVPQDPFIFRTTVRENLTVANHAASDAEIKSACQLANAWEFIEKLPNGLDTKVGEGGSNLSGGQRQRLAIARALLANPDFFIFDEATSALDTVSEHLVQNAMENAVGTRTTLIIAHRLATVKNCDRILVLANGSITQDGTYHELLSSPGLFQSLVQGQALK